MPFPYTFPFAFFTPDTYRRQYLFEIRDADGRLVRFLSSVVGGRVETRLNEPGEIRFSVPVSDAGASALAGSNEIWVRDDQDVVLGKYRIAERVEVNEPGGALIQVRGFSYLANLADEFIFSYSATAYVYQHLEAWVALQQGATPITVGTLAASVAWASVTVNIEEPTTILQALRLVEETLSFDSMFYVGTDGALNWSALSADDYEGKQLQLRRNLRSVERSVFYNRQATRLYAYGSNEGGVRVKLSDSDALSVDYIDATWARWKYRKQIVVNHLDAGIGARGQTSYALSYVETDEDLAAYAASDGSDITFLAADLETELSTVLNSYVSATGAIDADVTIPAVSGVKDTVIYMLYGAY